MAYLYGIYTKKTLFRKKKLPKFLVGKKIEDWDVSKVTDMSYAFSTEIILNANLGVTISDIQSSYKTVLDLSKWDVSNVKSMKHMFSACILNLILNWRDKVKQVEDMSYMFFNHLIYCYEEGKYAANLNNSGIQYWDVSNVTNMSHMFCYKRFFIDSPIISNISLKNWNVGNVTNMSYMFSGTGYNEELNRWNVSNVRNMSGMFRDCHSFNQPLDEWNVSNVRNMSDMFRSCPFFNRPLGNWNVSNVVNMSFMFADSFIDSHMFYNLYSNNLDGWKDKLTNVKNMMGIFYKSNINDAGNQSWDVTNFLKYLLDDIMRHIVFVNNNEKVLSSMMRFDDLSNINKLLILEIQLKILKISFNPNITPNQVKLKIKEIEDVIKIEQVVFKKEKLKIAAIERAVKYEKIAKEKEKQIKEEQKRILKEDDARIAREIAKQMDFHDKKRTEFNKGVRAPEVRAHEVKYNPQQIESLKEAQGSVMSNNVHTMAENIDFE